jgi:imidazolonepropionase-like amidohydrolase
MPRIYLAVVAIAALMLSGAAARQAQAQPLVITGVEILEFDGGEVARRADQTVWIHDGRVVEAADAKADGRPPSRIDGRGLYLMRGLTDMHVHLWDQAELGAYLAHGVTQIRNLSGMPFHLRLAQEIEAGSVVGPRLFTSGPILNSPGANFQVNHERVETPQEARAAVRRHHAAGFRTLKVYSNLSREAYDAIRDEAQELNMEIMGHSPEGLRGPGVPAQAPFDIAFEELLDDGFVTFEHVETIVWHGLRNHHDLEAMRALAARLAASKAMVDPTLVAFYNLLRVAETKGAFADGPDMQLLNPLVVAQEAPNYARWADEDVDAARRDFAFYQAATLALHQAGVRLVAGSDSGIFANAPGVSLLDELDLMVAAGLTPAQALGAATANATLTLEGEDTGGLVGPGLRADLILLDADPTQDMSTLRRPVAVIAAGRLQDRDALDALLAAARAPDMTRTINNLAEGLRAQGVDPSTVLGP